MSEPLGPPGAAAGQTTGGLLRGGVAVAAALAVANLLGYAFNLVASRTLEPSGYGALGALLGLVLIGNVAALGLQAVAARHVAVVLSRAGAVAEAEARLLRLSALTALGTGGVVVLTSPLVSRFLHLDSPLPVLLVAAALVPLIHVGTLLGLLQGQERMTRLAALYVLAGVGKVGGGLVGLVVDPTVTGALAGTAIGSVIPLAIGLILARPPERAEPAAATPADGSFLAHLGGLVRELGHASGSLLALFLLTNLDVMAARHWLPAREAGLYALGAVIAKGCFWLPQFVTVVAFPRLADPQRRGSTVGRAVLLVAGIGLCATTLVAVVPGTVVRLVGGADYAALAEYAVLFAAAGSLFALAQLLLMARLATGDRRALAAMWTVAAVELLAIGTVLHDSVGEVAVAVVGAAVALCCLGAAAELADARAARIATRTAQEDGISAGQGPGR